MTEKITVEVNAPDDGIIVSIEKKEGDTVAVGECLALLETANTANLDAAVSNETSPKIEESEEEAYDVAVIGGGPGDM